MPKEDCEPRAFDYCSLEFADGVLGGGACLLL